MWLASNSRAEISPCWRSVGLVAAALALAACGNKGEPAASQTAARVNKDEVTVHQINQALQQRNLRPEQAEAAGRQVLERLIDQQLAVSRGEDLKVDRDPRVLQQLEAARREILARAYFERVGDAAARPTPEEVERYYTDKPALFAQRRVYQIQEIGIEASAERLPELREKLSAAKNINEFAASLQSAGFRFSGGQAMRAAEQLPMASLEVLAKMKDGQVALVPTASGAQAVMLAGSRLMPVTLDQARPAIEQFLLNERKRKLIEEDLKAMRAAARIEYIGKFAEAAASAPAAGSGQAASPAAPAAPAEATALPALPAASAGLSPADLSKGLGLK